MKRIVFYMTVISVLWNACTEETPGPISGSSGKPEKVEILSIDTLSGGVRVSYRIPPANDVLEIKAVYTLTNGQRRESSASYYAGSLIIDGYNDTDEHETLIYTINRAREISDPVNVKFRPGSSPLMKAKSTMKIASDFGGVNFSWLNPDKKSLIFEFFTQNAQGEMATMQIVASKTDSTNLSFRGFDTVPCKFAVNIRDNFGNESGIIYPESEYLVPLYETKLDKTIQRIRNLAGDTNWNNWEGRDQNFVDEDIMTIIHSAANTVPGATITIDLGKKAKLSRFLMWQRMSSGILYNASNPRIFELYVTDDDSDEPDGDWSRWQFVASYTMIKPSGASLGTVTEDDRAAANKGHEFALPLETASTRYYRIKFMECWAAGTTMVCPSEITTYGFYDE